MPSKMSHRFSQKGYSDNTLVAHPAMRSLQVSQIQKNKEAHIVK